MRNLGQWIGAALVAQPFYSDEIRLAQMMLQNWHLRLPVRMGRRRRRFSLA
jgi:hypothetical protein